MMDEPEIDLDSTFFMDGSDETVCSICYAEFLDIEDLQTHTVQVHLTEKRKLRFCIYCTKIFPDVGQYMYHIVQEHLANLKCCKHCFRLFPDLHSKMSHEKKHKYRCKKEIFCSQCQECFNDKIFLERHEYNAHLDCKEGIMLNHGYSVLSSLLNMNVRRFLTGYNENMSYVCAQCQFTCLNMHSYIDHIKQTGCRTYACDICLNVYLRKKNLCRHFSSRHNHNDKHNIIECPKCQAMYTRTALSVHEKTCSLLKCIECHLTFNTVTEITNHRVQTHKECVLIERCKFCNKEIIGGDMMKKHIERSHQGTLHLYKYKCVYCNLIFKHPKQLFGHFYSSHKELEPYTCKICDRKFRIRKNFTIHVHHIHKSIGFLEFNENYHVSFVEKRSEKPFIPQSLYMDSIEIDSDEEISKTNIKIKLSNSKNTENKVTKNTGAIDEDSTDMDAPQSKATAKTNTKQLQSKRIRTKKKVTDIYSSDDSDVPLQKIRTLRTFPRAPWNTTRNKKVYQQTNKFTCTKCFKKCYTAQNYKHHMSLHGKYGSKECIKCEAKFKTGNALKQHVKEKHSNSVLTDTLKKVLERRKLQTDTAREELPTMSKRFKVAFKKVVCNDSDTQATLSTVPKSTKKVSVKNFIENFVPDVSSDNVKIKDCVTMGITTQARPPKITLHRCDLRPMTYTGGLKQPVKFNNSDEMHHQATIKVVQGEVKHANLSYGGKLSVLNQQSYMQNQDHSYCEEVTHIEESYHHDHDYQYDHYNNDDNEDDRTQIPEVAEEIMLEMEDLNHQQTITVANVPKEYKSIRIATLQPEAPYYKIVKIDDILKSVVTEEQDATSVPGFASLKEQQKYISLPNGAQLVAVNPLAHLIDTQDIKQKMPKRYYQPKPRDIGAAITKFLNAKPQKKTKKK